MDRSQREITYFIWFSMKDLGQNTSDSFTRTCLEKNDVIIIIDVIM